MQNIFLQVSIYLLEYLHASMVPTIHDLILLHLIFISLLAQFLEQALKFMLLNNASRTCACAGSTPSASSMLFFDINPNLINLLYHRRAMDEEPCDANNPDDDGYDEPNDADYPIDDPYDPDYEPPSWNSQPSRSVSANYQLVVSSKIVATIDCDIERVSGITSMPYHWAFQLYEKCGWKFENVYRVIESFKQLIHYEEDYKPTTSIQNEECEVCLEVTKLYKNSCSHQFCLDCWRLMLESSIYNDKELLPKCQGDQCLSNMSYLLIKMILDDESNSPLKKAYMHQLVLQYSRENDAVKVCPDPRCGATFIVHNQNLQPIWCRCDRAICSFCSADYHFPIDCAEIKNWDKMVLDNENQWIEIVRYKICPSCKNPIEKNEGCNHMTCRCKHEFCWICLKDWRTHSACANRQEYDRMEAERKKRMENEEKYRQKFEVCKEATDRYKFQIKRLRLFEPNSLRERVAREHNIAMTYTEFINEMISTTIVAFSFCRCCLIYSFFRGNENLQGIHAERVAKEANVLDDTIQEIKSLEAVVTASTNGDTQKQDRKNSCLKRLNEIISTEGRALNKERVSRLREFLQRIYQS